MLYPNFNELMQLKNKVSNLKLPSHALIKSIISGGYSSPFKGHGLEFQEVRRYVPGDDIRKIDWRVTARTDIPHIKLFTEEKERTVLIIVDMNESMRFGTRGTFKSIIAAKCAALLGWCANQNSNLVGGCLFGDIKGSMEFFYPKRRRSSLFRMFKLLCEEPVHTNQVSLAEAIKYVTKLAPASSLVFIISDFIEVDNELKQQLRYLGASYEVNLISINDPADKEISPVGNILFSFASTQRLYIDTGNESGRDAYQKQWEERNQALKNMATGLKMNLINLQTNRDIYLDLFYGLGNSTRYSGRK